MHLSATRDLGTASVGKSFFFEGERTGPAKNNMICKQLLGPDFSEASIAQFDKIVWIVRDPRDRLVSYILYRHYDHRYHDDQFVHEQLELLRRKELDPGAVSMVELERRLQLPTPTMQSSFFRSALCQWPRAVQAGPERPRRP
jgi:hypothetical protein